MQINGTGYVAVPTPGTPVQAIVASTQVKQLRITPSKASAVANTGNVYVGVTGMNRVTGAGVFAILRPTDASLNINRGDSEDFGEIDLNTIFIDVNTAADGVLIGIIT